MRAARVTAALAAALAGALGAACGFSPSGAPRDAAGDDTVVDAGCACALGCAADGTTCLDFDPSNLDDFGFLDGVDVSLVLAAGTSRLDTMRMELHDPTGALVPGLRFEPRDTTNPGVLVLAVDGLVVPADATLRVSGSRALLVLSRGAIAIAGTVDGAGGCDVEANTPARDRLWCGGPGGGDGGHRDNGNGRTAATGCAPGGNGDAGSTTDEHGGGGGGFGTAGGDGGGGDGIGPDSEGGTVGGTDTLEPLRGGSGGGTAGYRANAGDDNRTAGGGGGGALQLTAKLSIDVSGVLDVSGEGGAGTAQASTYQPPGTDGGGGGGAGGGILLEAPSVTLTSAAIVVANGGGGGAGIALDHAGSRGLRSHTPAPGGLDADGQGGGHGAIGSGDGEGA
ncbi:MAG TPA: hypothetical protein VHE35_35225, partial [Kofleriaceae bacterium]|nr:hypothetical protein [Kofleriaceae bacterium]